MYLRFIHIVTYTKNPICHCLNLEVLHFVYSFYSRRTFDLYQFLLITNNTSINIMDSFMSTEDFISDLVVMTKHLKQSWYIVTVAETGRLRLGCQHC
jgi:hypothetical protein